MAFGAAGVAAGAGATIGAAPQPLEQPVSQPLEQPESHDLWKRALSRSSSLGFAHGSQPQSCFLNLARNAPLNSGVPQAGLQDSWHAGAQALWQVGAGAQAVWHAGAAWQAGAQESPQLCDL